MVDARQQIDVVAEAFENGHEQLEVVRSHLRGQDRVARFLHFFGELARVRTLLRWPRAAEALASFGRGFFQVAGGSMAWARPQWLRRREPAVLLEPAASAAATRVSASARALYVGCTRGIPRGGFGVGLFIGLVFQRREQAAHANTGGAQVGDLRQS